MKASTESRERERQMKKAKYDYCKAKGICVICCREAAFDGRVRCPSCIEKQTLRQAKRDASMTSVQRERKNAQKRERYHRYKDAGRCTNCGKPVTGPNAVCPTCLIQQRRAGAAYRLRSGKKKGWVEAGRCVRCGAEPAEGRKLCPSCLEKNRELMAYARQFAPRERPWERRT